MTTNQINEILQLLHDEWKPYNNQPETFVYENLNCKEYLKKRPGWFYKGEKFICLGCKNKCSLHRPSGFQAPFPINYPKEVEKKFPYTVMELLNKKSSLNVWEVCYCLNVSRSQVYKMVREGELIALHGKPVRIPSEEIKAKLQDLDK